MPWDGCELWVGGPRGRTDRCSARARRVAGGGRRGVDLAAGVEPVGRAPLRERPHRLVEPLPGARRRRRAAACPPRPSSAGPSGCSAASTYAFLADGRIACSTTSAAACSTWRCWTRPRASCSTSISRTRRSATRTCRGRGRSTSCSSAAVPSIPRSWSSLDFSIARRRGSPRERRLEHRSRLPLRSRGAIAFPTEGGLTAFAHFYPPANPETRSARSDERPPLDRDEPRGSDVGEHAGHLRSRDPVLDEPRVRRRRRELRRQHRLRACVPASG